MGVRQRVGGRGGDVRGGGAPPRRSGTVATATMVILAIHYGEYTGVEARGEDLDDGEEDLWSGGAEGHEGEVGDCAVPHGHEDPLLLAVDRHLGVGAGVGGGRWGGEGG